MRFANTYVCKIASPLEDGTNKQLAIMDALMRRSWDVDNDTRGWIMCIVSGIGA